MVSHRHHFVGYDVLTRAQFIEGPLTKEYNLDTIEREPQLLEADDFVVVIQYHWVSDINVFPNERQRVQVATILLLAAFTGSRPGALLHVKYRDLRLYVEKHRKTGKHELKLGVTLTKTKSGKKRKRP
jgi:integrase